jgi:HSP20 family protein
MAESQTKRADASREAGQAVTPRGRDQTGVHNRQVGGSWFGDPFSMMDRLADDMDRSFDRMFRDFGLHRRSSWPRTPFRPVTGQGGGVWSPRIEAFQKGDQYIVRAELPGLKKDDVHVEITDDFVTVRGDRQEEHQEEREGYFHSEREYGEFSRTIPLPEGVITETAQASFKNGMLEITMPAPPAEANRGRRLEIKDNLEAGQKK